MNILKKVLILLISAILLSGCTYSYSKPEADQEPEDIPAEESTYVSSLFNTDYVHSVDISISENDWKDLLENPADKTKYEADIVIDGDTALKASFSAKGNSSLYFVEGTGHSIRYSFKINFGKYVKGQTWHGLDKLNLQNLFCDATYMKDYLSYDLFRRMDVCAPLASYVWLTVNGEDHGLYLAVEEIDDSFLERNFSGKGNLYKPQNDSIALDDEMMQDLQEGASVAATEIKGADLVYTDDLPEHYSDIFDNNVTKKDPESQKNVIQALERLPSGDDLAPYLDTEEIIRYFAVHNYLVNFDSYTGPMLHNYYLYENNGKLAMLPWDYNTVFGAFPADGQIDHNNESSFVVNIGIDTPLGIVPENERPMWNWIISDASYAEKYHEMLNRLITENFDSGYFEEEIATLYDLLLPYVEKDPTAFYSPEEFTRAVGTLQDISQLRAESIRWQLDGRLSAVTDQQSDSDRVDASGIDILSMGTLLE